MNYPRILAEISKTQWAMETDALNGIWAAVQRDLTSEDYKYFHALSKDEHDAISSNLGESIPNTKLTRVNGNVGSISINGPIVPRASFFTDVSGLVSIDTLISEFQALEADPEIESIVLAIDSPGGSVTGVSELASIIAGCDKRTTAFVVGMAASAAYWIASAADTIVSADTGISGSIGVISTIRVQENKNEIKIISSKSPLKHAPITSEEGRGEVQNVVDSLAEVFINTVAKNRGVSPQKVETDFGKGGVMVADSALAAGMIDEISTLSELMVKLESGNVALNVDRNSEIGLKSINENIFSKESMKMAITLKELMAQHPEIEAEITALTATAYDRGVAAEKGSTENRIGLAMKYIESDEYPKSVAKLACEVISGTVDHSALVATVAAVDAVRAESIQKKTLEESDGLPDTSAIEPGAGGKSAYIDAANQIKAALGKALE